MFVTDGFCIFRYRMLNQWVDVSNLLTRAVGIQSWSSAVQSPTYCLCNASLIPLGALLRCHLTLCHPLNTISSVQYEEQSLVIAGSKTTAKEQRKGGRGRGLR